eukprot:TRINITY_DN1762_c0_g1_i1.p1 TRINITY_DN1762_c0_g1~~TRINITY_DN1762_c0_g1_i1.p1  ORF type:complete len:292 (-),score=51.86 TRINITY_DN1762_c0_g1_i1:702-1463(-)
MAASLKKFLVHIGRNQKDRWAYLNDDQFLLRHSEVLKECPRRPKLLDEADNFLEDLPEDLKPPDAKLLWGGKYSRSLLHVDPYNWTGSNAVLRGEKLWRLIPPGRHDHLLRPVRFKCGLPIECARLEGRVTLFPESNKLPKVPLWEGIARAGDVLVIPSGWWHEAVNTAEETVAIGSQVISPQGGVSASIAEILRFNSRALPEWKWPDLPLPPSAPSQPSDDSALFKAFIQSLPPSEELAKAGEKFSTERSEL